jgi:cellulose synthase/poly-beta-1,6-N-acetylglucosamine synthase-like glycosyltransferase
MLIFLYLIYNYISNRDRSGRWRIITFPGDTMEPFVTILIPTKNVANYIEAVLQSMFDLDYPEDRFEIIILDAFSTDGTVEIANKFPVQIIQEDATAPEAYNHVLKTIKGDIVAFGDGDALVDRMWLKKLVRHFKDPNVGGAGGLCLTANSEKLVPRVIGYELQDRYERMPSMISRIATMNVLYRRSVLNEVGGFDESLAIGYDGEIGHKIIKKGYKIVFDKEAIVYHHHRPTLRLFFKQQFKYGFYTAKMYLLNRNIAKGDEVTSFWMNIQPFIYSLVFFFFIVSPLYPASLIFSLLGMGLLGINYTLSALRLSYKFKDLSALFSIVLYVARAVAWTLGGLKYLTYMILNWNEPTISRKTV